MKKDEVYDSISATLAREEEKISLHNSVIWFFTCDVEGGGEVEKWANGMRQQIGTTSSFVLPSLLSSASTYSLLPLFHVAPVLQNSSATSFHEQEVHA
tara:strand:- start:72 stop:365 length:294 start_codon:yes stop_codon:yes gene_type:complete